MAILKFVLLACLFVCVNLEEKRWIWRDKKQNARLARYEVVEDDKPDYHDYLEYSPTHQRPGGVYGLRPKPTGGYGLVNHPYRPGGVITGPEPTWSQPRPLKNFDKCKCSEKFNCPSPGITYGHCDVGKQYCCYVTKIENVHGEHLPARPIHSPENGVLVGPGGPVDYQKPIRPIFNRPGGGYGVSNGVLAGPGGGRPSYYQQDGLGIPYSPGIRPRSTE